MTITTLAILAFWIAIPGFFIIMACMFSSRISQAEESIDYRSFKSETSKIRFNVTKNQPVPPPNLVEP